MFTFLGILFAMIGGSFLGLAFGEVGVLLAIPWGMLCGFVGVSIDLDRF